MDGSFGNRRRRLTKFTVEAAKARGDRYELSDGGSPLRLIVFPSGAKSWAVRYRVGRRTRKLTIGPFPALSLKDARDAAGKALSDVAKGGDPAATKRAARERESDTVRAVVQDYVAKWQKPRNKTWEEVDRILGRVLVSRFGSRNIREISRRDLKTALRGQNRQVIGKVKHLFSWCAGQDIIDASPADAIRSDEPIVSRDRVLSDDELRAFLAAIREMGRPWTAVFELLALTAQRRSEVAEAPRGEFDLDAGTWTIAAERAKNGLAHIVPLAPRTVEIIRPLLGNDPEGFIFPAANDGDGAVSGFSKAKARLDRIMLAKLKAAAQARDDDPDRVKLAAWRIHDLRRTAATRMAALGHPIHVVERVLNHVAGATTGGLIAVYQRHDYLPERRAALEAWAEFLKGLDT